MSHSLTSPAAIAHDRPLRLAFVLTWATRTHVAPILESLRWLPMQHEQPVEIVYVCSTYTKGFASDFDYVKIMDCGFDRDTDRYDNIISTAFSTPKFDNLQMHKELTQAIADDYEICARHYLPILERERFDLVVCDFFDRAAMDAAAETNTKYAISTMLGVLGIGLEWYIPLLFAPMRIKQWLSSPFTRVAAMMRVVPFVLHMRKLDNNVKTVYEKVIQFRKPFMPIEQHFRSNLLLAHNLFGFDPARTVPSNMIVYGPIVNKDHVPPLEEEMQGHLDQFSASGMQVVFMAFGSLVDFKHCPALYIRLLRAVEQLLTQNPHMAVVWASKSHCPDQLKLHFPAALKDRLLTPAWTNQRRVLMHDATRVFVSHGGMGSVTESIVAGKPLLVLPLFGDQFTNAMAGEDAQIALQINKDTFTSDEVVGKVHHLLAMDKTKLLQLQQIARLNSKTSPVVVSNALVCAATAGVGHLLPPTVHMSAKQQLVRPVLGACVAMTMAMGFRMALTHLRAQQWSKMSKAHLMRLFVAAVTAKKALTK